MRVVQVYIAYERYAGRVSGNYHIQTEPFTDQDMRALDFIPKSGSWHRAAPAEIVLFDTEEEDG